MALEIPGFQRSWIAGGTAGSVGSDLSIANTAFGSGGALSIDSYRYLFVKFAAGLLVPIAAATDQAVGVLQNKPAPGQAATVMVSGVTRVRASDATIVVGSTVYIDQYGMATRTQQVSQAVGIAEEAAASANGFMISICLNPFGALK